MNNDDPRLALRQKAVETAIEWSKQITTLATGTLVLSGTFIKDLFTGHVQWSAVIVTCWIAMSLSALFGILYVGALCAMLTEAKGPDDIDLFNNGRLVALIHVIAFLIGIGTFIAFVTKNML